MPNSVKTEPSYRKIPSSVAIQRCPSSCCANAVIERFSKPSDWSNSRTSNRCASTSEVRPRRPAAIRRTVIKVFRRKDRRSLQAPSRNVSVFGIHPIRSLVQKTLSDSQGHTFGRDSMRDTNHSFRDIIGNYSGSHQPGAPTSNWAAHMAASPVSGRVEGTVCGMDLNGRGGEIRTPDPLLPKQMRYQAALRPDGSMIPSQRQPGAFKECNNEPPSQSNNRNGSMASASNPSPSRPMNSQSLAASRGETARLCSSRW